MMYLKMAISNLVKHRRRTLLIVFAVMVSVLVMEVVAGMFHGIRANFFRNLTQEGGHVTITASSRRDALNPFSLEHTIPDYAGVVAKLAGLDGAEAVEPVLEFGALLQHDERTVTLAGLGVLPDTRFYANVAEGLIDGRFPPEHGIVISRAIAELLRVSAGDELLVVVEDSTGSPFYLQYPVTGLFATAATEFDENTFFLRHSDAEELVYLDGGTTELRVRLSSPDLAETFAAAAAERLSASAETPFEIRTYHEIHEGLMSLIEMMDFFIVFMNLFVVIVAASVITNAILMNVFERIREFGTMRAIGLKKRGVAGIVLTEGFLQGVTGSLLGLLVGVPIVLYFSVNGLDFGGIAEAFGMGSSDFLFAYDARNSLVNCAGGILIALGGSLYAARTGVRLTIMEALSYG